MASQRQLNLGRTHEQHARTSTALRRAFAVIAPAAWIRGTGGSSAVQRRALGVVAAIGASTLGLAACSSPPPPAPAGYERIRIAGEVFTLELALDPQSRFKGLSGREQIPADGGMLFVFPEREVKTHAFVMRDCPVPIDIIFLDPSGRITAMHAMQIEPRRVGESDTAYEMRLTRYGSQGRAQFVIELQGGTIEGRLSSLQPGSKIEFDHARLAALAR